MKRKSSSKARPARRSARPAWASLLEHRLGALSRKGVPPLKTQVRALREGIEIVAAGRAAPSRWALDGQPFDRELLALSPLYRLSRKRFVEGGGSFRAALASSPRTLSSPILLTPRIEYSPIESELFWAATDLSQSRDTRHLLTLRTFTSSLFHEQSHRLLWRVLPPPPAMPVVRGAAGRGPKAKGAAAFRRYLNFVESLVVALDMALGDELGPGLATLFYLSGSIYDPGTRLRDLGLSRRDYRNYLQAAVYATYLCLEQYEVARIPDAVASLFATVPEELVLRAAERALRLDRGFVERTNPFWQLKHRLEASRALSRLSGRPWAPPEDPMDNREQYLFAEKWFEGFGL